MLRDGDWSKVIKEASWLSSDLRLTITTHHYTSQAPTESQNTEHFFSLGAISYYSGKVSDREKVMALHGHIIDVLGLWGRI